MTYLQNKRLFDLVISSFLIVILLPILITVYLIILIFDGYPVVFKQKRVGRNRKDFIIYKFRTMRNRDSIKLETQLTGNNDIRITTLGHFLRHLKIDELPQLFNVFNGDMSLVGPRPEVDTYIKYYNESLNKILSVKPGITDISSIKFRNESEFFKKNYDREKLYKEVILPKKIELILLYIDNQSIIIDLIIILLTILVVICSFFKLKRTDTLVDRVINLLKYK